MSRRLIFTLAGALIIVAGLSARKYGAALPEILRAYAPDALWTALIYCLVVILRPTLPPVRVWGVALLFSFAVEISQLYHAPWIDAIRSTRLGGLILGFGFLWTDLGCYIAGGSLLLMIDTLTDQNRGVDDIAIMPEGDEKKQ